MPKIPFKHLRVARVVGENNDGLTLFVPKDENGAFHLEGGERFLTLIFTKTDGGGMKTWIPWEEP
jgi:hypothetical protein